MKKVTALTSIIGALALAVSGLALAEHHENDGPPPLTDVWYMVPKAGMQQEFAKAVAEHQAMRAEMGDTRTWNVYAPVVGTNLNVYEFRACCFEWADQDTYDNSEKAAAFGQHWNANVNQYVDHYHHYFEETDWANSHWPDGQGNGPYYAVTSWTLKADAGPATSNALKEISELAKSEGWATGDKNWLWLSQIGGDEKFSLVSSYENFAAMKPDEQSIVEFLAEKIGEKKTAALFGAFSSGLASSDYTIWKHVPEMSSPTSD